MPPKGDSASRADARAPGREAEKEGFEPSRQGFSPPNALAGRRLQPLGHFSGPAQDSRATRLPFRHAGGVAERSNAAVSKTVRGGNVPRGFKSLPLRLREPNPLRQAGFGSSCPALCASAPLTTAGI